MPIGQASVIEPQQMQNGGVKIMDVNRIFGNAVTVFITSAIRHPSTHSATSQPGSAESGVQKTYCPASLQHAPTQTPENKTTSPQREPKHLPAIGEPYFRSFQVT
tara:strand:- start:28994 stop:29308 length:315 start_codon:yes stop_codon:yes gene_type:complete